MLRFDDYVCGVDACVVCVYFFFSRIDGDKEKYRISREVLLCTSCSSFIFGLNFSPFLFRSFGFFVSLLLAHHKSSENRMAKSCPTVTVSVKFNGIVSKKKETPTSHPN